MHRNDPSSILQVSFLAPNTAAFEFFFKVVVCGVNTVRTGDWAPLECIHAGQPWCFMNSLDDTTQRNPTNENLRLLLLQQRVELLE